MFEQRVLPITEEVMLRWRILVDEGRKMGHTSSQPYLIIAATALHHGLTLVTGDRGDFEKARERFSIRGTPRRSDLVMPNRP
jgi:predicted nucleic acid-binding protein